MRWSKNANISRGPENQLNGIDFRSQLQQIDDDEVKRTFIDGVYSNTKPIHSIHFRD